MAAKIKAIKEETVESIEKLKVTLKDKKITSVHIGNSYVDFINGTAEVSEKIYALIKESGIEVE